MARVLAFDDSSDVSDAPTPPPAQLPARTKSTAATTTATSRPLKRVARFLGDDGSDDNDDDDGLFSAHNDGVLQFGQKKKGKTSARDVERMFEDLDNDDNDDLGVPLRERQYANATQTSIIDDNILGGAARRRAGAGDDGDDAPDDKIDADAKIRKPKRKPVLMNEERLMGDRGIKRLKENLKGFKIKGKGHEEDDLRRLMNVYQLWAHQMYPAGSFRDTVQRVEVLCKKRVVKSVLKDWRDIAHGKLPPPLSGARGSDNEDEAGGDLPNGDAHADSSDDDAGPRVRLTTSQAGSPERNAAPKKSYFDDIPTSSPGGALSRDPDMADEDDDDDELTESLFGGTAPSAASNVFREDEEDQAPVASTSRNQMPASSNRPPTSEVGFHDSDLMFDLDDEFDADAEAEAAMMEMEDNDGGMFEPATTKNKGKTKTPAPELKTNPAISFYAEAKASERVRAGKNLVSETSRQLPSSSPAPRRSDTMEEENFEDFDFGEEEDMLREMEQAEQRQRKLQQQEEETSAPAKPNSKDNDTATATSSSVQASTSATPSLTASSTSHAADFDLDDGFGDDLEEDDDFLKTIAEAELGSSQKRNGASSPVKAIPAEDTAIKTVSPVKASSPLKTPVAAAIAVGEPKVVIVDGEEAPPLFEEEEEDLYS